MTNWTNTTRARLWVDTVVLVSATRGWRNTTSSPGYIVEKKTIPRATKKSKRNQNRIKPRTFLFWSVKYWPKKNRRLSLSSNFPGLRRIFPRKPSWKKMHDFCFTIPYGLVLIGGGVVGYMKKGSTASLGGGVGIGLVLILAGYLSLDAFKKRKNSYLAFVIETGTLFFFFSLSFFGFGFFMLLQVLCFLFVKKMKLFLLMGVRCNSCSKILEGRFREKFWSNVLFRIVLLGNWKVFVS